MLSVMDVFACEIIAQPRKSKGCRLQTWNTLEPNKMMK